MNFQLKIILMPWDADLQESLEEWKKEIKKILS